MKWKQKKGEKKATGEDKENDKFLVRLVREKR